MNNFELDERAEELMVAKTHYGMARLLVEAVELLSSTRNGGTRNGGVSPKAWRDIDNFIAGNNLYIEEEG